MDTRTCAHCEDEFTAESEDQELCQYCMDNTSECVRCGRRVDNDDTETSNSGDIYCTDCYNERYYHCHACGDEVRYDYGYTTGADDNMYCECCFDDRFTSCDGCGETIWRDDARYSDSLEGYYCEDCYPGDSNEYIHEYHDRVELFFHDTRRRRIPDNDNLYLGAELETDKYSGSIDKAAEDLFNLSDDEQLFHLEEDGSLNDGIEIITQPCTLDYHCKQFPWRAISDAVTSNGGRSNDTSTCGLHIHINNAFFGNDIDLNSLKLVYLFEKFWSQMVTFSRRTGDSWLRYADRYNDNSILSGDIPDKVRDCKYKGRYFAVNLRNKNTIEFRIFKGTLKVETILATLEFCDFMTRFVKKHTTGYLQSLTWDKFVKAVSKKQYPNLVSYMETRGLIENNLVEVK